MTTTQWYLILHKMNDLLLFKNQMNFKTVENLNNR